MRVTGDPDLAMHTAVATNTGALDIVGYVMLSSRTADEALRRGARLMRLLNDGLALHLTRATHEGIDATTATMLVLGDGRDALWVQQRQVSETIMAGLAHQLRLLTGRDVQPLAVHFRHSAPPHGTREHQRIFGRLPVFDSDTDAITFAQRDLDIGLRSANPALLATFSAHADAALEALGHADTVTARAAAEILARLKGEAPAVSDIAPALALSTRSLQRALAAEGTTYQALLDTVRRELAMRHLADPGATVAKVAWLVGFSEPSAFHRAWRRWTGTSPRAAPGGPGP